MDKTILSPYQSPRRPHTATMSPVSRWVQVAATVVPFTVLPSSLWRIALGFGVPVGFTGELAKMYAAPGWITVYVIVLSLITEAFAYLAVGLVRRWGEVFPGWVPWLGGRTVPVMAAVIPAALGVLTLSLMCGTAALAWNSPENNGDPGAPHGVAAVVMTSAYAPALLWPVLLAVVTVAYWVRRRRDGAPLWSTKA
jgi:hypothetical protein